MDTILITGLKLEAVIGAHNWEQRVPRTLALDLELGCDTRRAGASDRLADTVNYRAVADRVAAICAASRFRLIESLAEAIAAALLEEFRLERIRVTVHKTGAVLEALDVAVRIERTRG